MAVKFSIIFEIDTVLGSGVSFNFEIFTENGADSVRLLKLDLGA